MTISVKKFNELSLNELYDLLKLRSEVFVVEQNCIYQDIDGKDKDALHIIVKKNNNIIAYTRCFAPNNYSKEAAICRVIVSLKERKLKLGHYIIETSIEAINENYETELIKISAQTYLKNSTKNMGLKPLAKAILKMVFNI